MSARLGGCGGGLCCVSGCSSCFAEERDAGDECPEQEEQECGDGLGVEEAAVDGKGDRGCGGEVAEWAWECAVAKGEEGDDCEHEGERPEAEHGRHACHVIEGRVEFGSLRRLVPGELGDDAEDLDGDPDQPGGERGGREPAAVSLGSPKQAVQVGGERGKEQDRDQADRVGVVARSDKEGYREDDPAGRAKPRQGGMLAHGALLWSTEVAVERRSAGRWTSTELP